MDRVKTNPYFIGMQDGKKMKREPNRKSSFFKPEEFLSYKEQKLYCRGVLASLGYAEKKDPFIPTIPLLLALRRRQLEDFYQRKFDPYMAGSYDANHGFRFSPGQMSGIKNKIAYAVAYIDNFFKK